jgi:hypothetical protein
MNKEFIPYEQALALKELGFDEPCFGYYSNGEFVFGNYTNNIMQRFRYSSPTFSQAFRWFREKYNLYHVITIADLGKYESGNPDFQCAIYSKDPVVITNMDNYKTYEEAEQACLDKLIAICQKKNSIT